MTNLYKLEVSNDEAFAFGITFDAYGKTIIGDCYERIL